MNLSLSVVLEKKVLQKQERGDKKSPKGTFEIENLYFRKDRNRKTINFIKMYTN